MNVDDTNLLLLKENIDYSAFSPRLKEYFSKKLILDFEFGLSQLPMEPGVIIIRGPRQYGKSTWLDLEIKKTLEEHGPGSAFYINGDYIKDHDHLEVMIQNLLPLFISKTIKRIFIDEITAIPQWEKTLKRMWDQGFTRDILFVTTGSKALDLLRGKEKLPGRKGQLQQSEFIFLPISFSEFSRKTKHHFKQHTLIAYLITGGCPVACNELYVQGFLPEYWIQLIRDWIVGDIVSHGKNKISLFSILDQIFKMQGTPYGYTKLAKEAGLANNTIASNYMEHLSDLLVLTPTLNWNPEKKIHEQRKPCKFEFINLAAMVSLSQHNIRTIQDFLGLNEIIQGRFLEALVKQEIFRKRVIQNAIDPHLFGFYQNNEHEIDFYSKETGFIEVKRGLAVPSEFVWFPKTFPKEKLMVVSHAKFKHDWVKGVTFEDFLL